MPKKKVCFAEISCVEGEVLVCDFGSFGIIIKYDDYWKKDHTSFYFNDEYHEDFMDFLESLRGLPDLSVISKKMISRDFDNIEIISRRCSKRFTKSLSEVLVRILKRNFPSEVKLYTG